LPQQHERIGVAAEFDHDERDAVAISRSAIVAK
jgi:hypothetical protein